MSKSRIDTRAKARCLLTEIAPYETPTLFSNWGSYNYVHSLKGAAQPTYLTNLFTRKYVSVPFKYRIKKNSSATRTLSLVHPNNSDDIVEFYNKYDIAIIRACKRSQFSLRAPHHVARFYTRGKGAVGDLKQIEDITEETAYASSYFCYSRFSHLHKFFDSDDYTELEKRFSQMRHLDISKFFPSLYTHSVSWAVRGIIKTKSQLFGPEKAKKDISEKSFDVAFDSLLQNLNYKETHGIPIGPELCRIFSEVILQKIDATVFQKLKDAGVELGKQYWCYRYIDDFYIFTNDDAAYIQVEKCLIAELEKFKLYLNDDKHIETTRPFISPISIRKLDISSYLNGLFDRRHELRSEASSSEINKLRALIKDDHVLFSGVSAFLLTSLCNQICRLYSSPSIGGTFVSIYDAVYVYIDLAFHAFQMDIRVATSFKITSIVLEVTKRLDRLLLSDQAKLMDKIVYEMRNAFESALFQGSSVECMNLLIAISMFSDRYPLSPSVVNECIDTLRRLHNDEYSARLKKRLTYFEIVSLIYYVRDNPLYEAQKALLLSDAKQAISEYDPIQYAETAHLLLDLTACPFLSLQEKNVIIDAAMRPMASNVDPSAVGYFRNFVSGRSWYFNWTPTPLTADGKGCGMGDHGAIPSYDVARHGMLQTHLLKKQLLLSY
jgi:hypothetical protein